MTLCRPTRCGCAFHSTTLDISNPSTGPVTIEMPEAFEDSWPNFTFLNNAERDAELPAPQEGQEAYTRDAFTKWIYTDGVWRIEHEPWQTYTPGLTNVTLGTGGSSTGRFTRIRETCLANGSIGLGTGGDVTGTIAINMPVVSATTGMHHHAGGAYMSDASGGATSRLIPWMFVPSGGFGTAQLRVGPSSADVVGAATPWDWTAGDTIYWWMHYEIV